MTTGKISSYQLLPMPQGMLFENLQAQQPEINIEQMIFTLPANLQILAFQQG
jgi:hypothetical protein